MKQAYIIAATRRSAGRPEGERRAMTALTEAERIAAARWGSLGPLAPTPGEILRDGWLCWQLAGLLWIAGATAFWWAGFAFWQQAIGKGAHR